MVAGSVVAAHTATAQSGTFSLRSFISTGLPGWLVAVWCSVALQGLYFATGPANNSLGATCTGKRPLVMTRSVTLFAETAIDARVRVRHCY